MLNCRELPPLPLLLLSCCIILVLSAGVVCGALPPTTVAHRLEVSDHAFDGTIVHVEEVLWTNRQKQRKQAEFKTTPVVAAEGHDDDSSEQHVAVDKAHDVDDETVDAHYRITVHVEKVAKTTSTIPSSSSSSSPSSSTATSSAVEEGDIVHVYTWRAAKRPRGISGDFGLTRLVDLAAAGRQYAWFCNMFDRRRRCGEEEERGHHHSDVYLESFPLQWDVCEPTTSNTGRKSNVDSGEKENPQPQHQEGSGDPQAVLEDDGDGNEKKEATNPTTSLSDVTVEDEHRHHDDRPTAKEYFISVYPDGVSLDLFSGHPDDVGEEGHFDSHLLVEQEEEVHDNDEG